MKKFTILFSLYLLSVATFATTHVINSTASNTFNPAETTAKVGDIITFSLGGVHTATQVSESTWNANQNTQLSGGFRFTSTESNPSIILTDAQVGTIYFVCEPHASLGMKGKIIVQASTGFYTPEVDMSKLILSATVVEPNQNILVELQDSKSLNVKVYNMQGMEVANMEANASKASLPASFGRGLYSLHVKGSDEKVYIQKIVVE